MNESPIIEAAELAELLRGEGAPQVLDVRWTLKDGPDEGGFATAHIPGAQYVDFDAACSAPQAEVGGRHPLPTPEAFATAMQALGVRPERPVVVLDGGGSLAAARLWWQLTDAGHRQVRVLNGGFAAWQRAGLPTEEGASEIVEPSEWIPTPGQRARVDADGVATALDAGRQVIDVRAAERFRGDVEPIDPIAGHIPGAVNLPMGQFTNADGTVPVERVGEIFAPVADDAVFTCGSGATASLALLAYEAAGRRGAQIYPGSWSDWLSRGREVATGDAPL